MATNRTARISVRVDPGVKESADTLFRKCGLSMSDAVNMFLHQCLHVEGLPFTVDGMSKADKKPGTQQ